MYLSTKTYGTDRGLSCVFRQWKATSHCNRLHGYALGFRFTFGCSSLDERNWCVDFGPGGVGQIKKWLDHMFDHTMLIAEDDPERDVLSSISVADVRVVPSAGCEAIAKLAYDYATEIISVATAGRCWVESVECFEHGANSATYRNDSRDFNGRIIPIQTRVNWHENIVY